jgi:hypothetical protein
MLPFPRNLAFGVVVVSAGLAACAPDAWKADSGYDGWTNKVIQECYPRSIGGAQFTPLFNQPAFLDQTSRLYFGKIDRQQYTDVINSFYPGDNKAALDCIFAKLPPTVSPK